MNGVQGCTPFTFANGGNGMRMRNRLRKRRYAALGAAMWMLWGSSALCAAEGDNGSSSERVTTEAVNVEANYEKELLKEEPETKTIITREDLDRKGGAHALRRAGCRAEHPDGYGQHGAQDDLYSRRGGSPHIDPGRWQAACRRS